MEKVKILHVHGGLMLYGGTETFIMNTLRYLDKEKFEVDVVVHGEGTGVYDQEILNLGSNILRLPVMSKDPVDYKRNLRRIISEGNYDIVHSHLNSMNTPILKEAKKQGVNVRISHAHASEYYSTNKIKNIINYYNKKQIHRYATDLFSCSVVAGDFIYGNKEYSLWYNSIDLDKYTYNTEYRNLIREKHNISDERIFINVGRFNFQKNHLFLLDIFNQIKKQLPNSVLLLVGEGEEEENIKKHIKKLDLQDDVIFVGLVDNVHEYLSAADHFLLPSLFEGLPYVLVEAQATGLQIFSADTVAPETKIIDEFYFLPIDSENFWADFVNKHSTYSRYSRGQELTKAGFEVINATRILEKYYIDKIEVKSK